MADPQVMTFCIISKWMESGDLRTFLRENPTADRLLLVRTIVLLVFSNIDLVVAYFYAQLTQVSRGLLHLHKQHVVHGDLKSVR